MQDGLELRILGPVEALRDGEPIDLGPRRQRAVLARLLLEPGRPVSTDRLIEDVWGGRPPDGAIRTLRSYLSRLRAAVGAQAIASHASGYSVVVDADAVDAQRFERLAAEGAELLRRRNAQAAATRLEAALSLWRGEALTALPPEPFVVAEASRLDDLRVAAVEDRLEADLILGRHAAVVGELETLVKQHPLRERLWGQLMTALYRSGRQADALAAYRRARAVLREELGLEPGEELRRLEQAILRQELEPVEVAPAHNLPIPLTTFVGRELELEELAGGLARDRLVTVVGIGGSGKTRLAIEVARKSTGEFSDGVWMVDLSALSDPALPAQTVAAAVGADAAGRAMNPDVLADHLAGAQALLLLDNCEHLVEAAAALTARLLERCPRLHVLATSREPLGVPGEAVLELEPLTAPPDDPRADPSEYPAVRLFVARASKPPRHEEIQAVAQICRELDGLPLAIEIAAAQTRLLAPDEIAGRLADRFRLLTYWSRTAVPRHRTLRASLDWSEALLGPDERDLFHRLAVFAGGFTLEAVEAVAESPQSAFEILRRLVDASLVARAPGDGTGRFRLLETVRQYCRERLAASGAAEETAARHARHFAALARRAVLAADTAEEPAVYAEIDREIGNLRSALEWCLQAGRSALLGEIARGLGNFWRLRGAAQEGEQWLERAIELGEDQPDDVLADLYGSLGRIAVWSRGDAVAARPALTSAVACARRGGTPQQLGRSLHWLALAARLEGDRAQARVLLEEALELARSDGDAFAASHRLGGLSHVAADEGRLEEAERLLAEAWAIIQPAPLGHRVAYLDSVARLAMARGDVGEGERLAREGLAAAREMGDQPHVALNLSTLAQAARARDDLDSATQLIAQAFEVIQGGTWVMAELLEVLAGVTAARGGAERALTLLAAAAAQRERTPEPFLLIARPGEEELAALRRDVGDDAADRAWAAGAAMRLDEAIELARATLARHPAPARRLHAA